MKLIFILFTVLIHSCSLISAQKHSIKLNRLDTIKSCFIVFGDTNDYMYASACIDHPTSYLNCIKVNNGLFSDTGFMLQDSFLNLIKMTFADSNLVFLYSKKYIKYMEKRTYCKGLYKRKFIGFKFYLYEMTIVVNKYAETDEFEKWPINSRLLKTHKKGIELGTINILKIKPIKIMKIKRNFKIIY
jgi:hypothetical protein